MRKGYILPIFSLIAFWLIISGQKSMFLFVLGLGATALSYFSYLFFLRSSLDFSVVFSFRFLKYVLWLVIQILLSSFSLLKLVYSRRIPNLNCNRQLIVEGELFKNDVINVILGLSVTLTPGTVTVMMDNQRICFHSFSEDFSPGIFEVKHHISNSLLR
ncbi:Na+/H+ antiporter subunit E [Neorickettsia sennetsu]|uniref:Na+/H+ ion antiporter family protein n=1 Tax=Ehrlichia sennetsu (strain ATCC VR-367 / Miyayama) TaxID=222891 RepID=Q2GDP3_EHRS3|nr:Na+/H+ antiporter subunit E [Neorickettsia sennetsu]ABD46008.1 conserved hypothetical protein [Neorickettsia sennetsu str. Miyayama]